MRFGAEKTGRLLTLKASTRNSKNVCSVKLKFLSSDASQSLKASARIVLNWLWNTRMFSTGVVRANCVVSKEARLVVAVTPVT